MSRPKRNNHESWRDSANRKKPNDNTSKKWGLTIFGIVLFLLLFAFVGLYIIRSKNYTHVLTIATGPTNRLEVPIRFAKEDLDALRGSSYLKHEKDLDVLEKNKFSDLDTININNDWHKKDKLIVYVSAHGVSIGGEAFLLCKDKSKLPVLRILEAIKNVELETKLIIFDTGHIQSDPHMGIVVNEFPRLLEEAVQKIEDPNLWVLTSAAMFEIPQVHPNGGGTVFGKAVAAALHPEQGGRELNLTEFYESVFEKCERYGQHPILMKAGQGINTAEPVVLADLPKWEKADPEEATSDPPQTPASDSETTPVAMQKDNVEGDKASSNSGNPDAGENKSKASEETKGPGDSPAKPDGDEKADAQNTPKNAAPETPPIDIKTLENHQLLDLIFQQRRDRLELGSWPEALPTDAWAPTDFSPQIWRRYVEFLVDLDVRSRSGADFDAVKIKSDLRNYILNDEQRGAELDDGGSRQIVSNYRLAQLGFQNLAGGEFYPMPNELGQAGEAIVFLNRTLFYLPYYIRWHYWSTVVHSNGTGSIEQLLLATADLKESLTSLAMKSLPEVAADKSFYAKIGNFKRVLRNVHESIFREKLFAKVDRNELLDPAEWQEVEFLLSTPLPSAAQRAALLKLRAKKAVNEITPSGQYPSTTQISESRKLRIIVNSRFRRMYLELTDTAKPVLAELESIEKQMDFAKLGLEFQARAESIRQNFKEHANQKKSGSVDVASRMRFLQNLKIVDARDAFFTDEYPCLPFPTPKSLKLIVSGSDDSILRVNKQAWKAIKLSVKTNEDRNYFDLSLAFPKSLEVRRADTEKELVSGQPLRKIHIREVIPLEIKCREGGRIDNSSLLRIATRVGDSIDSTSMSLELNEIGLRIMPPHVTRFEDSDFGEPYWKIRPFPGRSTAFEFFVTNDASQEKRDVKVELHALPRIDGVPQGILFRNKQVAPKVRALVEQLKDNRKANTKLIAKATVPLIPANGVAPCKFDIEQAKPAENENTPKGNSENVSPVNGMAMVLTDTHGRKVWLIEFDPLHPREYLEPRVTYDVDAGIIHATFSLKDNNKDGEFDGPADLSDQPIVIDWGFGMSDQMAPIDEQSTESVDRSGTMRGEVSVKSSVARLHRNFSIPEQGFTIQRFHVDGYPRAFAFRIDQAIVDNRVSTGKNVIGDNGLAFARINWLAAVKDKSFGRLYHTWQPEATPTLAGDSHSGSDKYDISKLEKFPFDLIPNHPRSAAFPAVEFLTAEIQVDAPQDQFGKFRVDAVGSETFYRRRQILATSQIDGQSRLSVATRVQDFRIKIPTAAVFGERRIEVTLDYRRSGVASTYTDFVDAVLSSKKTTGKIVTETSVKPGEAIQARALFTTDVGLRNVRLALVENREESMSDEAPNLVDTKMSTVFPAPDVKKLKPGMNQFWVKGAYEDRVGYKADLKPVPVSIHYVPPKENSVDSNPATTKTEPVVPKIIGTLKVRVTPQRASIREVTTTIRGEKVIKRPGGGGLVQFSDVPQGKYTIKISRGLIDGRDAKGEVTVDLKEPKDFSKIHELEAAK